MDESEQLEGMAMALWRQYGYFLGRQHKEFLLRLALLLKWKKLEGVLR